jgi:hypothetical protein
MDSKKEEERKAKFYKRLSMGERSGKLLVPATKEKAKDDMPIRDQKDSTKRMGGAKRLSNMKIGRIKPNKRKEKEKEKDKVDSFYVTTQKVGESAMHASNMDQKLAIFYLHDDESTFWTLRITDETTAWVVCRKIEEKLHLKDNFDCFIRVYERTRDLYSIDRLMEDYEVINAVRQRWVKESKSAIFVVRVIRMSSHPTRIATEGYDPGPKIISFLPDKVISRYLFSAGEPPTKPLRESFPAVVMFVDIAGFTAFTENLLKEGGDMGIEGLTLHLNQLFQKLIGVIKSHHGDVIQFGGDALLVVWHSPLHKLSVLAAAACCCGMDIQATLLDYHTSSGTKLSLYVGIAAGTMENIHVGSPGNWIIVFGGEPVSQLSRIMVSFSLLSFLHRPPVFFLPHLLSHSHLLHPLGILSSWRSGSLCGVFQWRITRDSARSQSQSKAQG